MPKKFMFHVESVASIVDRADKHGLVTFNDKLDHVTMVIEMKCFEPLISEYDTTHIFVYCQIENAEKRFIVTVNRYKNISPFDKKSIAYGEDELLAEIRNISKFTGVPMTTIKRLLQFAYSKISSLGCMGHETIV